MNDLVSWAALAPLAALAGALVNALFGRRLKEPVPGILASLVVAAGFILSLLAFFGLQGTTEGVRVTLWHYLSAGSLQLDVGFMIDRLSVVMMMIITGIGLLIHVYSIGYMHGDEGYARFFAELNLFVAAMLVLVMADSFVLMYVGWEGVAICSYLLIAFWYRDRVNADAGRKAFIVNRVADVGFLLAMFLTFRVFGTLDIAAVNAAAPAMLYGAAGLTGIGLLFLVGAVGKSAQLPLQVWLPDAMAGPTPVSALIHAATMVTAGVYLIVRLGPVFAMAPEAAATVAWIGVLTALLAAFAAIAQTDIKRVLAYSTISQVGFMVAAAGAGAYWVAIFHVVTHAFFKALLFLDAGSVIHALGGEQDMRKMGGLGKKMRVTGTTALIATFAIAGVPFFAGFFSKDAILSHVLTSVPLQAAGGSLLYALLLLSSVMTAFYMFRWYHKVFAGSARGDRKVMEAVHESPAVMTVPLVLLAIGSIVVGYIGLPAFAFPNAIQAWFAPISAAVDFDHLALSTEWLLVLAAVLAAALGLGIGYWIYQVRKGKPAETFHGSAAESASRSGVGFDALYQVLFVSAGEGVTGGLASLDREVLDRGLRGLASGVGNVIGRLSIFVQSGYARAYALAMLIGAGALAIVIVLKGVLG